MNCTASAPMINPITRFMTLSPVTPRNFEMRSAATSMR